ncbi:Clavaminate synthase-like protein [Polyplosphaeria fusca]|uniref:Clavaminate synthase-like protein n=1 Tax=Polyplosphaeria fusca TaxID=682080 RepID=A0A9P4R4A9_9PLEO|nr:Clavaminate synthase-like protein [Polyplosphaeria fusca]
MVNSANIPVIDISNPSPDTAQEVLSAASTHGFLFIRNDGSTIPQDDITQMFNLSRTFFTQPTASKSTHSIHTPAAGGKNRGWVTMQGEALDPDAQKTGDPKEAFNIAPPFPTLQPLPPVLQSSSALISRFQTRCHAFCNTILTLLASALSISDADGGSTWFARRHDQARGPSGTIFRMLYYPATQRGGDDESVRAGAHSDYGSVTLLFRLPGQPGLEILRPDGMWAGVPVNPAPDALGAPPILVNIGDLLSFWTGGMLKSTVHRVAFSGGEERYSMAYFCHPLDDAELETVPSKVVAERGDAAELERQRQRLGLREGGGKGMTAKEHLDRRLKVTYGLED